MVPWRASCSRRVKERVVGEVVGFGFVEEEEVDAGGAEGSEAAVEGGFGFGGGEERFCLRACCGAGCLG